ncbi:hypothetical protein T10_4948 [Trichinella papuae]|uniref:MULE transposase domain-containing protein n=1 Tax=Trichinella papuae TaxID=268474 RepID=A0A0V1MTS0_9BILA|nr:hypothetical protein T10_4948 [Trichinella papuae]
MDDTFNNVPQWYQQLFTIHAFVAGKLVPAVYCLCTGKDIGTYGYIFQALLNKAAVLRRSTEETKSIPQIYDEEAAAPSAEPSTFGQFPFFKELGMQSTANGPNAFPDIQEITKM